jgi:hypothetical protein
MIGRITGLAFLPTENHFRVVAGVQIRNLGPQTTVHEWNGRHVNAQGANTHLTSGVFDTAKAIEGESGTNLIHDERVIEQGAIRSGWLAFRVSREDQKRILENRIDKNLDFSFADTFGKRYRVTMFDD